MEKHPLSFGCRGEEENPKGAGDRGSLPTAVGTRKNEKNPLFGVAGDEKK